jgi:predicted transcriptional regulator
MGNIYLAKSDLTGHVYAVKGRSKTDVTDFVVQLIKAETEKLRQLVKSAFNAHQVHKVYDTDLVKIMDEWCEQAREALALAEGDKDE